MNFPWLVLGVLGTASAAGIAARLTRQCAAIAVVAFGVILLLHGPIYFEYTSDDAYISYRYARNVADGLGVVWNPGEHVEGYSNFLWVMALAGFAKTGADIVESGRWLGFGLALVAGAGTYRLTTELLPRRDGGPAGLAASLLLAASGPFALWAAAGLETSLFAVVVLAAVMLHIRETSGRGLPVSGAVWGIAYMVRPDAPLLFAVSALWKAGESVARIRRGDTTIWDEISLMALWGAAFAAIFVPYFAWRYSTFGYVFPNPYYAKVGTGLDQYERGLRYAYSFISEYATWLVVAAPLAAVYARLPRGPLLYVVSLFVAWVALIGYVGGDSLLRFRLLAPMLPLFYAAICASGAALLAGEPLLEAPRSRSASFFRSAVPGLAVLGLIAFTLYPSSTDGGIVTERQAIDYRTTIGRWLRTGVPPDTSIAVVAAGAIPYESGLLTVDMLGINDEHIAHRDLDIGLFAAGHEKYDSAYVLGRSPDIIIITDGLTTDPLDRDGYEPYETNVIPAVVDMLGNEQLWVNYEARSVQVGGEALWFNLLVRRDANAVLQATIVAR